MRHGSRLLLESRIFPNSGEYRVIMGDRPEEMLARAGEIRYPRKRASKKVRAPSREEVASQPALQEVKQVPLQVLVDLTCPHCQKKNSFAVIQERGRNHALREEVL